MAAVTRAGNIRNMNKINQAKDDSRNIKNCERYYSQKVSNHMGSSSNACTGIVNITNTCNILNLVNVVAATDSVSFTHFTGAIHNDHCVYNKCCCYLETL